MTERQGEAGGVKVGVRKGRVPAHINRGSVKGGRKIVHGDARQ